MVKKQKLEFTFTSDLLFKIFFVRHESMLKRLIALLLNIKLESIKEFRILNSEIPPELIKDKLIRLDIHMVVNGKHINLEIQVANEKNYPERSMFHFSKICVGSLPSGSDYSQIPEIIIISILDYKQFNCDEFRSEFAVLETTRYEVLSDKQKYCFIELPKLPSIDKIDMDKELLLWLSLFNAKTWEELEFLSQNGGEIMEQAVLGYKEIISDESFRYIQISRDMAMHDAANAIKSAENNARLEEREKWQGVVAEQKRQNEEQKRQNEEQQKMIADLLAQLNK